MYHFVNQVTYVQHVQIATLCKAIISKHAFYTFNCSCTKDIWLPFY